MRRIYLRTPWCRSFLFLLLVYLSYLPTSLALESNYDLSKMTIPQLDQLEQELKDEVATVQGQVGNLRQITSTLKEDQKAIEDEANKLLGANEWEKEEKRKKEEELIEIKNDVEQKQESMNKISIKVNELRNQIKNLDEKLKVLAKDKIEHEKKIHDPTLIDVLNSKSQGWSGVSKNMYEKTKRDILPAINEFSESARLYQYQVRSRSRFVDLIVSLIIYGFVLAFAAGTYNVYKKVRGNLTIQRLLFIGDAFCAAFWILLLFCFCILFSDPLRVVQQRFPRVFFLYQMSALVSYVAYVFLRVIVLAAKMTFGALFELLAVIIIGHHFYIRVWQPAITDQQLQGTPFYYICYAWLFSVFAYNRIQEFAPLKQLRGESLPPSVWFKILKTRFTSPEVPDGDIETSRRSYETADDDHFD